MSARRLPRTSAALVVKQTPHNNSAGRTRAELSACHVFSAPLPHRERARHTWRVGRCRRRRPQRSSWRACGRLSTWSRPPRSTSSSPASSSSTLPRSRALSSTRSPERAPPGTRRRCSGTRRTARRCWRRSSAPAPSTAPTSSRSPSSPLSRSRSRSRLSSTSSRDSRSARRAGSRRTARRRRGPHPIRPPHTIAPPTLPSLPVISHVAHPQATASRRRAALASLQAKWSAKYPQCLKFGESLKTLISDVRFTSGRCFPPFNEVTNRYLDPSMALARTEGPPRLIAEMIERNRRGDREKSPR